LSVALVAITSIAAAGAATGGTAATAAGTLRLSNSQVEFAGTAEAAKSMSGRIAQSDPELLGRSDAASVNVMVKYDYDGLATYAGGIPGLAATSPKVTGKELKENPAAVAEYSRYVDGLTADIGAAVESAVPSASIHESFETAYGGVTMTLPANQIDDLLAVDGVVAVQKDVLNQPQTDVTPGFIGATAAWSGLGGSTHAGEGVIVGVLDTGIWPEHPSFADNGIAHPGGSYQCQFGNGLDPALGAPFTCNDKLIGAYAFTNTYLAVIGALPGEYCNNVTGVCSARDSEGHGTHTASTAAGSAVSNVNLLGVNRGNISGIAPGASVIMYRVCLVQGCFNSDSVAAVNRAILDGVDVLNFSIGGGNNAYTDPVELAFLDAYNAGILVNASAGNSGPGAGTAGHAGPWTNTVGASTSNRHFLSTLVLTASNGDTYRQEGVTVTAGLTNKDVALATAVGSNNICSTNATPALANGKVIVCQRGTNARVDKGFRMFNAGAAGMILFNPVKQDLESDNHWLPAIHIEGPLSGTHPMLTFLSSHTGVKATWASGSAQPVPGDVMAAFSSRGPLGDFIKPDVTSVGIQVLAGNTPTPISTDNGPPGQLYQAIAGTSMSSPHAAGASALVKAAHPNWTPGQIKSALMTSSTQAVKKEDGLTNATPFDRGAGSIRVDNAIATRVVLDVSAADYLASATDPLGRIDLNLPSINAPTMPGSITTQRTLKNVSSGPVEFEATSTAPAGSSIDVLPRTINIPAGGSKTITIRINGTNLPNGQYFGQITLADNPTPRGGIESGPNLVFPVAFFKQQGIVPLTHTCTPTSFATNSSASCVAKASNFANQPADATLTVQPSVGLRMSSVGGSPGVVRTLTGGARWSGTLSPSVPPQIASITAGGSPAGYLPLALFGITPIGGVGDDTITNFTTPTFFYGGESYSSLGVVSNGYLVLGGGAAADIVFTPQVFPNPARPNNVVAPFWSDLNPAAAGAIRIGTLTDGVSTWIVVDWAGVRNFSNPTTHSFEVWLKTGTAPASEEVTMAYGTAGPGDPASGVNWGAENRDGTSGKNLAAAPANGSDWKINTTPPQAGGVAQITYNASALYAGVFTSLASLTSSLTPGVTQVPVTLNVSGPPSDR
jgi:subtilisin family serine protease